MINRNCTSSLFNGSSHDKLYTRQIMKCWKCVSRGFQGSWKWIWNQFLSIHPPWWRSGIMMSWNGFGLLSRYLWSENLTWQKEPSPMLYNKRLKSPLSSGMPFYGYKPNNHSIWTPWREQGSTQIEKKDNLQWHNCTVEALKGAMISP